jgi:hypothetical protein
MDIEHYKKRCKELEKNMETIAALGAGTQKLNFMKLCRQ